MHTSTAFRDRFVEQMYKDFPALSSLPFSPEKRGIEDFFIAVQYMSEHNFAKTQALAALPLLALNDLLDLKTLALYSALPYHLHDNFEINWPALEACESFTALPNGFSVALIGPAGWQWKMILQSGANSDDYKEAQWIRVATPPIAGDVLMKPQLKRPMTAVDIPCELHDLITHYFVHEHCMRNSSQVKNRGHECRGQQECKRNYVRCSQDELRNTALVCQRWAHAVQPVMFQFTSLSNREVIQLETLLKNPTTPIRQYVSHLYGELDGAEHLRNPSIHNLGLSVIPKLSELKECTLYLKLEGPLPKKHEMMSSIHPPFPRVLPCFSAGIQNLHLRVVHFKTFTHLMRLIREMPSLHDVDCEGVTWGTREGEIIYPTSFLARDNSSELVNYEMRDCTDDAGAAWLGILLGQTRADVLNRLDADSLCAVAKAGKYTRSIREQDRIMCRLPSSAMTFMFALEAFLTPRAPKGVRDRRRISAIRFWPHRDIDWRKIDEALATSLNAFGALQLVLFVLYDENEREGYLARIAPSMPFLTHSPKLKFALSSWDGRKGKRLYTQAALEDGEFRKIGEPVPVTERFSWEAFLHAECMLADLARKSAPLVQSSTAWPSPPLDLSFHFRNTHHF
ncbi:hypothetical protein NM688_g5081 [Phlebia brevispora]|uniref:Uncharacterized protein n=1 Tax=Phlebia brevispora TaxID=194682 RepID=A0ACC1T193_9APHY|nr:hypothetical protein NM688_g5081 [Phlebia brevispora]